MFQYYCCILIKTERINRYWLISRRSLCKQNTRHLKVSCKRFSERVLTIFIFYQFLFATHCEPKGFFSACIACSECWHECKGNVKFHFWKRTLSVWILITRKQAFVHSEKQSMAEREEKRLTFCFTNQASCMDVSRGRKQITKSGQCHPEYKGKHCETRKWWDCSRKVLLYTLPNKIHEN